VRVLSALYPMARREEEGGVTTSVGALGSQEIISAGGAGKNEPRACVLPRARVSASARPGAPAGKAAAGGTGSRPVLPEGRKRKERR
jgi:hypothetical protein